MADYSGEYGHPYPRVDQYGNPVAPVDQYGIPIPREPIEQPAYSSGAAAPSYGASDATGVAPAEAEYGTGVAAGHVLGGAAYPHEGPPGDDVLSSHGAAHTHEGEVHGGLAPGETTAYPHEGVLGGAVSPDGMTRAHTHEGGVSGGLAPGDTTVYAYVVSGVTTGDQIQPTRDEHTTLGETLRRSGSSSSSSSSEEDDGQGGRRRKKKSLKEKIKEKLPGGHKHDEHKPGQSVPTAGTGMQAAGTHEKKGIMDKIKEKLPGHH